MILKARVQVSETFSWKNFDGFTDMIRAWVQRQKYLATKLSQLHFLKINKELHIKKKLLRRHHFKD